MSYVLIENEQISKYPLSRADIEEIGASVGIDLDTIEKRAAAGIFPVYKTEIERAWNKNYVPGQPVMIGDSWFESWNEVDKTQEEIDTIVAAKWVKVRKVRNQLLGESDWTQLPDCPLSAEKVAEWSVYRQQLRDITENEDPFAIVFPTSPLP